MARLTDTQLRQACENVKLELRNIIENETEGTGQLAASLQVQRGTQRGKPIIRIMAARHATPFFRGTTTSYAGIPPNTESELRFKKWASIHSFNPRRLAFIIAKGRSTGKVYSDRTDMLVRAMRLGFRNFKGVR